MKKQKKLTKRQERVQFLEALFAHILDMERKGIKINSYKILIG